MVVHLGSFNYRFWLAAGYRREMAKSAYSRFRLLENWLRDNKVKFPSSMTYEPNHDSGMVRYDLHICWLFEAEDIDAALVRRLREADWLEGDNIGVMYWALRARRGG